MAKAKRGRGRPTKYKPEYCEQVIELGRKGKSVVQIAAHFDVCRDSIQEWSKVHEDFSVALRKAKSLAEAYWEDFAEQYMVDIREKGGAGQSINFGMFKLKMANRFGWSDKQEVKTEGSLTINIAKDAEGLG